MEAVELINSFVKVIKDSENDGNKISVIDTYDILKNIKDIEPLFAERYLEDWINYCRMRKPGYVIEDIIIIMNLGKMGIFGQFKAYDTETLQDWLFKYGIKQNSKEDPSTKRNYYLGEANRLINRRSFERPAGSVSLADLKNKYGADYMKENFPNLVAVLKGASDIGIRVDSIPVTNKKH